MKPMTKMAMIAITMLTVQPAFAHDVVKTTTVEDRNGNRTVERRVERNGDTHVERRYYENDRYADNNMDRRDGQRFWGYRVQQVGNPEEARNEWRAVMPQ